MLDLGTDVCLCSLDQILQPSIWSVGQRSALAWPHCNSELRCRPCHLGPLCNALVAGIAVHHLLIAMQQRSRGGEVVHIGRRGDDRMDQAGVLVDADMDLPLRGPPATSRSTTGCPSWSGASPDPVHRICFWWSWVPLSRWHQRSCPGASSSLAR